MINMWWYILASVLIVVGLIGSVLPVLPGVPLMFAGMLLVAWVDQFKQIGAFSLFVLGFLTLLTLFIDWLAGALGAKVVGASRGAVIGAAVGTLVGIFFGLPGLLIGPFLGGLIGEWYVKKNMQQATRAGIGATLGFVLGSVAKIAVSFAMLGVFVAALIF